MTKADTDPSERKSLDFHDMTALGVALAGAVTVVSSSGIFFDGYDAIVGIILILVLIFGEPYEHLSATRSGRFFVASLYALCGLLIIAPIISVAFLFLDPKLLKTLPEMPRSIHEPSEASKVLLSWASFLLAFFLWGLALFRKAILRGLNAISIWIRTAYRLLMQGMWGLLWRAPPIKKFRN